MKKLSKCYLILACIIALLTSCKEDEADLNFDVITEDLELPIFNDQIVYGTLEDQEGNIYKTVTINTDTSKDNAETKIDQRVWMAENLRTTTFNDGSPIFQAEDTLAWDTIEIAKFCSYEFTERSDSIQTFGYLYDFNAVNSGKLCPEGWHVSSDEDWDLLSAAFGGDSVAGDKLKEIGDNHWVYPNDGATNASGFTALPAGSKLSEGGFVSLNFIAYFWCSNRKSRVIRYNNCDILNDGSYIVKDAGLSVRCVRN